MKIAIIGCVANYGIEEIRPYVNSIIQSGFTGRKILIVYSVSQSTIQFLTDNGWEIYEGQLHQHVILQRFTDTATLIDSLDDDVIISTDVKDVIFQSDPTSWLERNMTLPILATSECIRFKDEEWAVGNAGTSFPTEWEWLKEEESYCAGVIIGKREYIRDLFKDIYRWASTGSNPTQLADQAAFNILIRLQHIRNNIQFVSQEEGLVVHMGVPWMKRHTHANKLLSSIPNIIDGETITNIDGVSFYIVHQYDRDIQLKHKIVKKYS